MAAFKQFWLLQMIIYTAMDSPTLLATMVSVIKTNLTHFGLVMQYGVKDLDQHWFR